MTLLAGVDVGNATTEIVIADASVSPPRPLAWDRSRTRGLKGSAEASGAAARLLDRLQDRSGLRVEQVLLTPQVPVATRRTEVPVAPVDTGRLVLLALGGSTPGGEGWGVGRPADLAGRPPEGPVIAVSLDPLGFQRTADTIRMWLGQGVDVRGVLLAGDEATLVSRRLSSPLPVVDGADAQLALTADAITLEVAPVGRTCHWVNDPLHLATTLGLAPDEHADAKAMAAATSGHRSVAIMRLRSRPPQAESQRIPHAWFADGSSVPLTDAVSALEDPARALTAFDVGDGSLVEASDLWLVDPDALQALPGLRSSTASMHRLALASIDSAAVSMGHVDGFRRAWDGPITVLGSEMSAARAGALSTPGARLDATIVDLGGGTIDVIGPDSSWTGAGCGDLMTTATAIVTQVSHGAAEWVKRGPASRIETPHLAVDESGERRFLETPAARGSVGWLVVPGPSGLLPFSKDLSPPEWRALRLALKQQIFGRNLARGLRRLASSGHPSQAPEAILVGGPAGDEEITDAIHGWLRAQGISRANVGGLLGHRWAVAYGLILLAAA